jgi:hypothetical protein
MTFLVCIPTHYCLTERIRFDRAKAQKERQEAVDEAYKLRAELADKNRQPRWTPPRYKDLTESKRK